MSEFKEPPQNDGQRKLDMIKAAHLFVGRPMTEASLLMEFLNTIPFISGVLRRHANVGLAIDRLGSMVQGIPSPVLTVTQNIPLVNLSLRGLDFIQIPLVYWVAFLLGKRPPITLSKTLRWFYTGMIFALLLTAVLLPVTLPFITVGLAGLILFGTSITLWQALKEYRHNKTELEQVIQDIHVQTQHFEVIQKKASQLEVSDDNLKKGIEPLYEAYLKQCEILQALYDRKLVLQDKMNIEQTVSDQCFTMLFYLFMAIGGVLLFFLPPVGLGIMIGAGLANGVYLLGMVSYSYFRRHPDLNVNDVSTVKPVEEQKDIHQTLSAKLQKTENNYAKQPKQASPELEKQLESFSIHNSFFKRVCLKSQTNHCQNEQSNESAINLKKTQ